MTRQQICEMFPIGDPLGRILGDPISAVVGGGGLVGNLIGGAVGSSAAKKSAGVLHDAATQAGKQVTDAAAAVNPTITAAADKAGTGVVTAAQTAGAGVTDAANTAGAGVTSAATNANLLLDPYAKSGVTANDTLTAGLAPGGDFNKTPTLKDLQIDPSFQFFEDQGIKTKDRSAAARGGVLSGTAAMDLENFKYGVESQEYQKAFDRFRSSTSDRFSRLNTVAGRGVDVAGTEGANLIGAGKYTGDKGFDAATYAGDKDVAAAGYAGDKTYGAATTTGANTLHAADSSANYLTQGANAEAGGIVGSANAITGAIGGATSALGGAAGLYLQGQQNKNIINLLKNPASKGVAA